MDGVSIQTSVAPGSAARTAPSSLATMRTSTPRGRSCSTAIVRDARVAVAGDDDDVAVAERGSSTAATAAMPDENSTASPPSSSPSAASYADHVGFA